MTEPLTDEEIAALAHAWEIDDAAPLLEDHVDVRRPIYMHDIIATFAADRKRIKAAERVVCAYERMISWEVRGCGKKTHEVPAPWNVLCEELDVALAVYRDACPAKKGD